MRIKSATQDGFTVCIQDRQGNEHCFRIDKEIGAELVKRVELASTIHAYIDGKDCDSDTLGWISSALEDAGFEIRGPDGQCVYQYGDRIEVHT
jgi:hypothetical protein